VSCSRRHWLLALLLLGCTRNRRRSGPIARVVSLSPSTTEAVFALGAGPRLVGRSRYCDYPSEVEAIPAVGGFVDPSLEAVLALQPDLVTGVQGPGLRDFAERLAARGIETFFPPTQSLGEICAMLRGLGKLLAAEPAAEHVVATIEAERDAVGRAVAGRTRPRALFVFGLRPIVVAGPGSFPDEMLRLAGADNVVVSDRNRFPTLGIEQVIAFDPDVVIDATGGTMREGISISRDLPGWSELRALAQGRLVRVNDDRVLRPGPRVGQGLGVLARALHPDAVIP
jgi:iron complex transport system substrate-binding protein